MLKATCMYVHSRRSQPNETKAMSMHSPTRACKRPHARNGRRHPLRRHRIDEHTRSLVHSLPECNMNCLVCHAERSWATVTEPLLPPPPPLLPLLPSFESAHTPTTTRTAARESGKKIRGKRLPTLPTHYGGKTARKLCSVPNENPIRGYVISLSSRAGVVNTIDTKPQYYTLWTRFFRYSTKKKCFLQFIRFKINFCSVDRFFILLSIFCRWNRIWSALFGLMIWWFNVDFPRETYKN